MPDAIPLDGPYYDQLDVGDVMPTQPGITLDSGLAAFYQSIVGERLPLCLDAELCKAVTGSDRMLASPGLVMQTSIGQSTTISRRAIANLFYRDLRLVEPVFIGDTISTTVTVAAMADSAPKEGRRPRGKVLVDIFTTASGRPSVSYQRCPLLPTAGDILPGHHDNLGSQRPLDLATYIDSIPEGWNLDLLGAPPEWAVGQTVADPTRDVIDGATALVRLTHNLAMIHRDAGESPYEKRLAYGGHVVGLAQASLSRVVPALATVVGWQECNHTGPAFEGDLLSFRHTLIDSLDTATGRLLAVRVEGSAHRGQPSADGECILEWTVVALTSPGP